MVFAMEHPGGLFPGLLPGERYFTIFQEPSACRQAVP